MAKFTESVTEFRHKTLHIATSFRQQLGDNDDDYVVLNSNVEELELELEEKIIAGTERE